MFKFFHKRKEKGTKRCPHKKLIGRKLEWIAIPGGMPQSCVSCGSVYLTDIPKVIKTPSGVGIHLCNDCRKDLKCGLCGEKLRDNSELYVAECMHCNTFLFICKRCADRRLFVDLSKSIEPDELVARLYSIVNELMEANKGRRLRSFWGSLFKKKKSPDLQQLFPLIMNINMYFSEDMGTDFYYDDFDNEDWWLG